MEEKRVRYWFRGNKEHGRELIGRLVNEFGATNSGCYGGTDEGAIYFINSEGKITSRRKTVFDEERYKDSCIESTKVVEDGATTKVVADNETIPAEKLKPTSTVITAPFYRVQDCECVRAEYYPTYEDAKAAAEKISEEQNTKTYILAPIAKLVPTVTVAMAEFNFSDMPKGC